MEIKLELTKKCSWCDDSGKKYVDEKGRAVHSFYWSDAKQTNEKCPRCFGTLREPTDIGEDILKFVKTYTNAEI